VSVTLNRTKFSPPSRKGALVLRAQLLERLGQIRQRRLTVVQAPAGFGKTSLLAQLHHCLQSQGCATGWLSLDSRDNDYASFLGYLVTVLKQLGADVDDSVVEAAKSRHESLYAGIAASLSNALASLKQDCVVFLDDHHVLVDPEVEQLLAALLQSLNSRVTWVIATRDAPLRLPLSRLRLFNELVEIGAGDLTFSNVETEQFFRNIALDLQPDLASALNAQVEGWVAGLQLAALMLRGAADRAALVRNFSGGHRNVADYFKNEVLLRLGDDLKTFLLETSMLSRMNVELCNHVTGRSDARRMLDRLEGLSLFIFSLDADRTWYRYHHLFADLLSRELKDSDPGRWRTLHARASEWLAEHDHPVEALDHAAATGDQMLVARLLDGLNLFSKGQIGVIERFAARIPEPVLEQFPNLQLERIWEWEGEWDFRKSRAALARLERVMQRWKSGAEPAPPHVDLAYIEAKLAHRTMMVYFVADDMAETERLCGKWFSSGYKADNHMELSTAVAQMAAQREHYRSQDAAAMAWAVRRMYQERPHLFGSIFHDSVSGLTLSSLGELAEARDLYGRAYENAVRLHGRLSVMPTLPALLLAGVYYEQNRLDEAWSLVADYLGLANSLGYVDKLIAGYITKSRMEFANERHGFEAAQRTLDDGERRAGETGFERLRVSIVAERARQLVLRDQPDDLFHLAQKERLLGPCADLSPREGVTTRHEKLAITWARIAALRGNADNAVRLLKSWYQFTLARCCYGSAIGLAVELARLLHLRQESNAACHYMRSALRLGHGQFIRTFLDQGEIVRQVLSQLLARRSLLREGERQYAQNILQAFAFEDTQLDPSRERKSPARAAQPLLNPRELEILELAADDLGNREIARRLSLSENTVKWYWRSIFSKLQVHRRVKAVSIARAGGMIF
jgi:ATP/maltotriose-dependent transcriptional regulator MalT